MSFRRWALVVVALGLGYGPAAHAAPAKDERIRIAVVQLRLVNVDPQVAALFTDVLAQQMAAEKRLAVTTPNEMAAVLGYERQRQMLGCTDDSSCLAELAGALGASGLITGSLGRLEDRYVVSLKLVRAADATPIGSYGTRARSQGELVDWLETIAPTIAADAVKAFGAQAVAQGPSVATPAPVVSPPMVSAPPAAIASHAQAAARGPLFSPWIPAAGAAVTGVGAVVTWSIARNELKRVRTNNFASYEDLTSSASLARTMDVTSVVLIGGTAALLGVSGWALLSGTGPTVAVSASPQGAYLGIAGELP